jgi:uncharacterized damage-inducible protein DinB
MSDAWISERASPPVDLRPIRGENLGAVCTSADVATKMRIERLQRTPRDLEDALSGRCEETYARRPAEGAWSAKEVICHLRDIEEAYLARIRLILANHEPTLVMLEPDRWVAERQYDRQDTIRALVAFRLLRDETLALVSTLTPEQWEKAGLHPARGRMTVRRIVHSTAKHDDGHLEQLKRALDGQP